MKNYIDTIKKALLFWLIAWIAMLWVVYAANIISSVTTQTINTWDTISQSWYQDVNDKLSDVKQQFTIKKLDATLSCTPTIGTSKVLTCSNWIMISWQGYWWWVVTDMTATSCTISDPSLTCKASWSCFCLVNK